MWNFLVSAVMLLSLSAVAAPTLQERALAVAEMALRQKLPAIDGLEIKSLDFYLNLEGVRQDSLDFIARPVGSINKGGRQGVWVDIYERSKWKKSVLIPFNLTTKIANCWFVVRDLPTGTRLQPEMLRQEAWVAPGLITNVWAGQQPVGQLKRPVRAGQPLLPDVVEPLSDIQPGDEVQLKYRQGGIELMTRAIALQGGVTGQKIVIKLLWSNHHITGLIAGPGHVDSVSGVVQR